MTGTASGPGGDTGGLARLLGSCTEIVVFTGAGVSTESGLPDFRSSGGIWERYDPRDFTFQRYVEDADVRRRSWRMRRELHATDPDPNPAHEAIAHLEQAGRSPGVITQNIDGLHQEAGSETVVELHGTTREVACIGHRPRAGTPDGCGWRAPTTWALQRVDDGEPDPACPDCGGLVKAATVSFGQGLDPAVVAQARRLVVGADCLLAVGSSLQVYPAAGLPELAADRGAALTIVNAEPTPLDARADVVVHGRAGRILPRAVEDALSA